MTVVTVTDTFNASIDQVWPMVSDFGGIATYMRGIDSARVEGEGLGQDRIIGMGGGEVVERLCWLDDQNHAFSYTILSSPLPVARYLATVKLTAQGEETAIEWQGNFEADGVSEADAIALVQGIYTGGIKGYKKALG